MDHEKKALRHKQNRRLLCVNVSKQGKSESIPYQTFTTGRSNYADAPDAPDALYATASAVFTNEDGFKVEATCIILKCIITDADEVVTIVGPRN